MNVYTRSVSASIPAGQMGWVTASCDTGDVVTGGGYHVFGREMAVLTSYPHPSGTAAWLVSGKNTHEDSSGQLTAYAVCADVSGP